MNRITPVIHCFSRWIEMKKIRINGEAALIFALMILAFGMVFTIKANLGMTVVQAPVYVLSEALTFISIGVWNFIIQSMLFIVMLLIVKRFKISYIFSFIAGFVYGGMLDLFVYLLKDVSADGLVARILFYIIGFTTAVTAVALFFTCKAPLMPYDIFIREITEAKKIKFMKFKWIFDIVCVLTALTLSLTLTKGIIGVGVGTLIFAVLISPIATALMKIINKHIEFHSLFK